MKWFKFHFELGDDATQDWGIQIHDGPCMDFNETCQEQDDKLEEDVQGQLDSRRLEHIYGVHDFSCDRGDFWGYTTYEVPADKISELMTIWHDIWIGLGYTVGQPERIDKS